MDDNFSQFGVFGGGDENNQSTFDLRDKIVEFYEGLVWAEKKGKKEYLKKNKSEEIFCFLFFCKLCNNFKRDHFE